MAPKNPTIGIRELKNQTSHWIHFVTTQHKVVTISKNSRPIAVIKPLDIDTEKFNYESLYSRPARQSIGGLQLNLIAKSSGKATAAILRDRDSPE